MKKFTFIIAFIFAVCVSCSQSKHALVGAYNDTKVVTNEDIEVFNSAISTYDPSLHLTPQKVSHQVVAGLNYRFLCTDEHKREHTVVIYKPLPGNGEPTVTSFDNQLVTRTSK